MSIIDKNGYKLIKKPNHPMARKNGYILIHRLIMANYLGRLLATIEVVHHKNGNKLDNRIENLELVSDNGKHLSKLHPEVGKKVSKKLKGRIPWNKGKILVSRTPEYFAERRRRAVKRNQEWRKRNPKKYKVVYTRYNRRKSKLSF